MGVAKKIFISILNTLLIISLSIAIISLTFNLFINEQSLNNIIIQNLEPFVDEQLDATFGDFTQQQIDAQHSAAIRECENNEIYEIARQGSEIISLDCNEVTGITPNAFIEEMKQTVKDYTMSSVTNALDESLKQLWYFQLALWISAFLCLFLTIIIILVEGRFSFKTFGTTGMIAGSPFIIILASQALIFNRVKEEINNSIPPEILEQLTNSTLIEAIMNLITNFVLGLVVGFAILFLIGLTLFIIGLFIEKKPEKNNGFKQAPTNNLTP